MTAFSSSTSANHTKCAAGKGFTRAMVLSFTVSAAAFLVAHAAHAEAPKPSKVTAAQTKADPFAGDVWHAINGTWPGTLVFDGKTKKVVLTPVGAQAIQATYEVVKAVRKGDETQGSLRMRSSDGQQVEASFVLKGSKSLSMRYSGGQRDETYVRMNPAEEEAEKARLLKMLEEKKFGSLMQTK